MVVEPEKRAVEKKEEKKMTLGQKIKHEAQHYWDGTKLLATEVRISVKLAMKMAAGYELSRRENRQVCFTVLVIRNVVLTNLSVTTYGQGSGTFSAVLRVCDCSLCRIVTPYCSPTLPQHAPQHLRRTKVAGQKGRDSSRYSEGGFCIPEGHFEGDWSTI